MKLITKDTDYALRAVSFISKEKNKIVSVAELVQSLKVPGPFLRKILQILNRKAILKSYRGQSGGFLLAKPADKIFLVDLIEIFQGPIRLNECFLKDIPCANTHKCALRKKLKNIEHYVINKLKAITITSLLER